MREIAEISNTSDIAGLELRPGQSIELLKELHILTREGRINQDSRRKLKQVYHLYQFIEPLLEQVRQERGEVHLVDHGAGKSYLGFILYDLYFKAHGYSGQIVGVEARDNLVEKSQHLAAQLDFQGMSFLHAQVADTLDCPGIPQRVDIVTALHACDTATDDAIRFALHREAQFIVLVPCCQAEVAALLRQHKSRALAHPLAELWRHPIHTREFGSHATNVLRCLQLQSHGYEVSVTELVGWEHSMKNELIIASRKNQPRRIPAERLETLLRTLGLAEELRQRFFAGWQDSAHHS